MKSVVFGRGQRSCRLTCVRSSITLCEHYISRGWSFHKTVGKPGVSHILNKEPLSFGDGYVTFCPRVEITRWCYKLKARQSVSDHFWPVSFAVVSSLLCAARIFLSVNVLNDVRYVVQTSVCSAVRILHWGIIHVNRHNHSHACFHPGWCSPYRRVGVCCKKLFSQL